MQCKKAGGSARAAGVDLRCDLGDSRSAGGYKLVVCMEDVEQQLTLLRTKMQLRIYAKKWSLVGLGLALTFSMEFRADRVHMRSSRKLPSRSSHGRETPRYTLDYGVHSWYWRCRTGG